MRIRSININGLRDLICKVVEDKNAGRDTDISSIKDFIGIDDAPNEEPIQTRQFVEEDRDIHQECHIGRVTLAAPPATWDDENNCIIPGVGRVELQKCQNRLISDQGGNSQTEWYWKKNYYEREFFNFCFRAVRKYHGAKPTGAVKPDGTREAWKPNFIKVCQETQCCKYYGDMCPDDMTIGECGVSQELGLCDTLTVNIGGVESTTDIDPVSGAAWDPVNISPCRCDTCEDWNTSFELKEGPFIESGLHLGRQDSACCFALFNEGFPFAFYFGPTNPQNPSSVLWDNMTEPTRLSYECHPQFLFPCSEAGDMTFMTVCIRQETGVTECHPSGIQVDLQLVYKNCQHPITYNFPFDACPPESGDLCYESLRQFVGVNANNVWPGGATCTGDMADEADCAKNDHVVRQPADPDCTVNIPDIVANSIDGPLVFGEEIVTPCDGPGEYVFSGNYDLGTFPGARLFIETVTDGTIIFDSNITGAPASFTFTFVVPTVSDIRIRVEAAGAATGQIMLTNLTLDGDFQTQDLLQPNISAACPQAPIGTSGTGGAVAASEDILAFAYDVSDCIWDGCTPPKVILHRC